MKLQLKRPLAVFDIEATGLQVGQDRIVEIAVIKMMPDGSQDRFHALVNPEMKIPQEVIEIHGITDERVKDEPTFAELVEPLVTFLADADLAGYNSNKFDIPLLAEELLRVNSTYDLSKKRFVDVQNIFHKMEQRTLAAALQFYCQKDIENAHSAMDDTQATLDVLLSQLDRYENLKGEIDFLADFSRGHEFDRVDFAGRLAKNKDGSVVYNFGKHRGKTVEEISESEPGYYGWFVSEATDFPKFTKLKLKEEMERIKASKEQNKGANLEDKLSALKNKFNR